MISHSFRRIAAAAALVATSCSACAQQADFNEVGRQVAITLQNAHFLRIPFDKELSRRFLSGFLRDLDFQRVYFTQRDVDAFEAKYGDHLQELLLSRRCMEPAREIYGVFTKRVEARVALAEKLLKENKFDFTADDYVARSRKDAPWPKDEAEANKLWTRQIKEAVLAETLRLNLLSKLAKEQNKPDLAKTDKNPAEKVAMRYKRFLNSVRDVDDEDIANFFLSAVATTYDPHTDYMSAREMDKFKSGMKNELVGIGALLQGEEEGATKIMGIVVGGPADRAGQMKLNDRVVAVDRLNSGRPEDMVDIMFMKIDKVVDMIRGESGSEVALKVEPAGGPPGQTKIYVIKREKVELKDEQASAQIVEYKGKDGEPARRLGMITLPSFYADFDEGKVHSSVDVERLLDRLMEERIDGLVLDLRNNGGGSLDEVCRMTGLFLGRGPVVQVKNNRGRVQVKDSGTGKIYDGPMVVMTDKSSASASEILAGALQDANRAVIVGDSSTYGKGTVQAPMSIAEMMPYLSNRDRAGFIKLTIQKFYRPSGSSTQKDGVVPQLVLPSLLDGLEIGETYLDNVMPHDSIERAPGFKSLNESALYLPKLKEESRLRVNGSKDFEYILEDVMRAKKRIAENRVSLNMQTREKDLAEAESQRMERNKERRDRFGKVSAEDKKQFRFYKLTLDDVDSGKPLSEFDPEAEDADFMRRAKDEAEQLDDSPKWPSGLDPVKRESLMILRGLIDATDQARMAGVLPKNVQEP